MSKAKCLRLRAIQARLEELIPAATETLAR